MSHMFAIARRQAPGSLRSWAAARPVLPEGREQRRLGGRRASAAVRSAQAFGQPENTNGSPLPAPLDFGRCALRKLIASPSNSRTNAVLGGMRS
jgi:hypothetical protein